MNSFLKFLILFVFDIISSKIEEIKPLTTLIVSYNETQFIRIDDYFNNATQNFSINNPFNSIFNVSLSDSFSILMTKEERFLKYGSIIKVESLKSIKSEIILYENNFILLSWNDFENVGRIDIIECKRKMIRPQDWIIFDMPASKCQLSSYPDQNHINCYDVKEIDSSGTDYNATIMVECEYKSTVKEIKQFIAVYGIKTTSDNSEEKIDWKGFYNTGDLQINIPGNTPNKFCQRKIKISSNNALYRYCPYSSLSNQTKDASQLILQKWQINVTMYQLNLVQNLSMNETKIEDIEIVNDNFLLIMEGSENLKILNITNLSDSSYINTYNYTQTKNVGVYKVDDSHYFFLTNESFSALSLDSSMSLNQDLKIDLQDDINPSSFFYSTDYFFVVYNNRTKIYSNYTGGKQQQIENSAFFLYLDPSLINFMLGFDEKVSKNSFLTLHEFPKYPKYSAWSVNITKVDKKKLSLFCCNKSALPFIKSLDKFYFFLVINKNNETIQNATIQVVYWNINDDNLYFGNRIYPELNDNKSNYYEFDSENIFIPYKKNLVLGQMITMNLRKSLPPSKNSIFLNNIKSFIFDDNYFRPYRFTFDILKSKLFYLNIEINGSLFINIYFQNSRDYFFTIITCLFDRNYAAIQDCAIPVFIKDVQQIKKIKKFYSFIIYQYSNNHMYWSFENKDILQYPLLKDKVCLDYEINDPLGLIFCVESGGSFLYGILTISDDFLTLGYNQSIPIDHYDPYSLSNKIVTDLLIEHNCLILFSPPRVRFYEVSYKKNDSSISTVRVVDRNFEITDSDSNFFIYKESKTSNFMMIIKKDNYIKEYSLENKYEPVFVRNYPTFDYQIDNTFSFMEGRFLYLRMQKDKKKFLLIYDAEQFTSNLIKRKIDLDPDDFLAPVKFVWPQNAAFISDEFLQISKQSCILLASKSNISLLLIGNYDIYGGIKQIFTDNNTDKLVPFNYHLVTSFENSIMKAKLVYDLQINITFTNSIVKTKVKDSIYYLNQSDFINFTLLNNIFSGPIENYKLSDENLDIYPYLKHELDFQEYSQNNMTGLFIKVLNRDFLLVVLAQKKILFLNVSQGYTIINEYLIPESIGCYDIFLHRLYLELYVFCSKLSNKELSVLYFNLNSISPEQLKPRKILEFNDFFKEYVAVAIGQNHLFFLTNEEIIISNNSKINAIYIFNTSNIDNVNCKPTLIGKINDVFFNQKDFNLVNALDMQIFSVLFNVTITQKNFYGAVIIFNQKFEYLLLEVYDGFQEKDAYIKKLDWKSDYNFSDIMYSNSMNHEFSFYSISIIDDIQNLDNENEIYNNPDFNFNILVSSSEHIYEYQIQSKFFNKTLTFLYEKFYSCIFNINTRPKKKKGFVGSFCIQDAIQNGNKEPNFNYFVLHKVIDVIDVNVLTRRVNPVFALPIFLKNYNLQLIVNSGLVQIVLPSFSNLFSVYSLSNYIFLNKTRTYGKSQTNSVRLTAYNQVSSAYIDIVTFRTVDTDNTYIIVLCILIPVLFLVLLSIGIRLYIIKKRKRREDEYIDQDDYYKISNDSLIPNVRDSSTHTNSLSVKRTSSCIINAKKKIEKWG